MRKLMLITAAVLGLAGTAWAEDALEEMAKHDPSIAKIIQEEKADGTYRHPAFEPSKEDRDAVAARLNAETEIHLRKMGMSPETAKLAVWGASHRPNSACAHYVRQLTADYDSGADRGGYDEDLVAAIEHSGTCERKNLD
ncbi:hypothetical protein NQF87_08505 [Bombella sp. TMW 2.2559]|uniref:Uncharacterized protein n=1 Tax=Bombella dulcis TaxID=2967339 RepID=A0ABT3WD48_9PROT|nr:hypothetical protein [Bombella dulcis]MCX5617007.1 hypothetical protein [Bombella dulcis]